MERRSYDFDEQLAFSVEAQGRPFEAIIADTLPGIASVTKTSVAVDKTGIDYIAKTNGGAQVNIDLKLRDAGCSSYWATGEEELALEVWSVKPENGKRGRVGWTLDDSKATDYTLHAFDPLDSTRIFLLPFQLLRASFKRRGRAWYYEFENAVQSSGQWRSECIFVPVSHVLEAIGNEMERHRR